MDILVFKTNLENMVHIRKLYALMKSIQGILRWNVDLEDIDRILRIEAEQLSPRVVEVTLQKAGYFCKELED